MKQLCMFQQLIISNVFKVAIKDDEKLQKRTHGVLWWENISSLFSVTHLFTFIHSFFSDQNSDENCTTECKNLLYFWLK